MRGIIKVIPSEAYYDPQFKVGRIDRSAWEEPDVLTDGPVQPGSWIALSTVLRRGSIYILEAKSPAQELSLKFSPEAEEAGIYSIKMMPRGPIEQGETKNVIPIKADATDLRFKDIMNFEYRFVVSSLTSTRPFKKLVWLIGFELIHEARTQNAVV